MMAPNYGAKGLGGKGAGRGAKKGARVPRGLGGQGFSNRKDAKPLPYVSHVPVGPPVPTVPRKLIPFNDSMDDDDYDSSQFAPSQRNSENMALLGSFDVASFCSFPYTAGGEATGQEGPDLGAGKGCGGGQPGDNFNKGNQRAGGGAGGGGAGGGGRRSFNRLNDRNVRLNAKICEVSDSGNLQELLELIENHHMEMNSVNLSTLLHRIARTSKKGQNVHDFARLQQMSLIRHKTDLELIGLETKQVHMDSEGQDSMPRCLATIAWSYATLQIHDNNTYQRIARLARSQLHLFKPCEISNLLWALAKMQIQAPALLDATTRIILNQLDSFSPMNYSTIAWSYVTLQPHPPAALLKQLSQAFVSKISPAGSQEIANMCWALATAKVAKPQVFQELGNAAAEKLHTFNIQELANTAWSFSRAGVCHSWLFSRYEEIFKENKDLPFRFPPQGLANLLWAMAKQAAMGGDRNKVVAVAVIVMPACREKLDKLKAVEFSSVLWSCAKLGIRMGMIPVVDSIFEAAATMPVAKLASCSVQGFTNVLHAFTEFLVMAERSPFVDFLNTLCGLVSERIWNFEPIGLLYVLESVRCLMGRPEHIPNLHQLAIAASLQAAKNVSEFRSTSLSRLAAITPDLGDEAKHILMTAVSLHSVNHAGAAAQGRQGRPDAATDVKMNGSDHQQPPQQDFMATPEPTPMPGRAPPQATSRMGMAQQAGPGFHRQPAANPSGAEMSAQASTMQEASMTWEDPGEEEFDTINERDDIFSENVTRTMTMDRPSYYRESRTLSFKDEPRTMSAKRTLSWKDDPCHITRVDSWSINDPVQFGLDGGFVDVAASKREPDEMERRMLTPLDQIKTAEFLVEDLYHDRHPEPPGGGPWARGSPPEASRVRTAEFLGGSLVEPEALRSYLKMLEVQENNLPGSRPQVAGQHHSGGFGLTAPEAPETSRVPNSHVLAGHHQSGGFGFTAPEVPETSRMPISRPPGTFNPSMQMQAQALRQPDMACGPGVAVQTSQMQSGQGWNPYNCQEWDAEQEAGDYYLAPSRAKYDSAHDVPAKVPTAQNNNNNSSSKRTSRHGSQDALQGLGPQFYNSSGSMHGPPGQFEYQERAGHRPHRPKRNIAPSVNEMTRTGNFDMNPRMQRAGDTQTVPAGFNQQWSVEEVMEFGRPERIAAMGSQGRKAKAAEQRLKMLSSSMNNISDQMHPPMGGIPYAMNTIGEHPERMLWRDAEDEEIMIH